MLDGLGVAHERRALAGGAARGVAQQLHHGLAGLFDVLARDLGVAAVGRIGVDAGEGLAPEAHRREAAVAADELAEGQPLAPPPLEVGGVAEGADHQDAGALLGIGELAGEDRHRHPEERGHRVAAEQVAVATVFGVGGHADAGRQQLGAGGGDGEGAVALLHAELDVVEGASLVAFLHLGLGHGRLEVHVPHGGCVAVVEVPLLPEVQEGELRERAGALADGLVELRPVDRQGHPTEQALEGLLVLGRDALAELDEVRARDQARRLLADLRGGGLDLEPLLVPRVGVAAHVEVVLDAPLGGEPVVVPADGVVDVLAAHATVAGQHVGVRVGEDVADVEGARHRGGRGVDHEGLVPRAVRVPAVHAAALPLLVPAGLRGRRVEVLGERGGVDGTDASHGSRGVAQSPGGAEKARGASPRGPSALRRPPRRAFRGGPGRLKGLPGRAVAAVDAEG